MLSILLPEEKNAVEIFTPLLTLVEAVKSSGRWQEQLLSALVNTPSDVQAAIPRSWSLGHPLATHFSHPYARTRNYSQKHWETYYVRLAAQNCGLQGCAIFWLNERNSSSLIDLEKSAWRFLTMLRPGPARVVVGGKKDQQQHPVIRKLEERTGYRLTYHTSLHTLTEEALQLSTWSFVKQV